MIELTKTVTMELNDELCYDDALRAWNECCKNDYDNFEDFIKCGTYVGEWIAEQTANYEEDSDEGDDYMKASVICKSEAREKLEQTVIERYKQDYGGLNDIETIDNTREYETTLTYDMTIDYKEMFIKLLNFCKKRSNYQEIIRCCLYSVLINSTDYEEDRIVIRDNDYEMQQGYSEWLVKNWDILKTNKDIPDSSKTMIQEEVDRLKKRGL